MVGGHRQKKKTTPPPRHLTKRQRLLGHVHLASAVHVFCKDSDGSTGVMPGLTNPYVNGQSHL
jgi:hypothetical protein